MAPYHHLNDNIIGHSRVHPNKERYILYSTLSADTTFSSKMVGTKRKMVLAIFVTLLVSTVTGIDEDTIRKIDEFVKTTNECRDGIGMTLSYVKGGETVAKGYGVKDVETGQLVTEKTLFDIGSVSKHFATTLLGILLDEDERFVQL